MQKKQEGGRGVKVCISFSGVGLKLNTDFHTKLQKSPLLKILKEFSPTASLPSTNTIVLPQRKAWAYFTKYLKTILDRNSSCNIFVQYISLQLINQFKSEWCFVKVTSRQKFSYKQWYMSCRLWKNVDIQNVPNYCMTVIVHPYSIYVKIA